MSDMGVNFSDLRRAVDSANLLLKKPRDERREAIRKYVGSHYSDDGSRREMPTNFLEMMVTIFVQSLAARAPRCTFRAKIPRLKPWAFATEIALNQIPEEIGLDETLRRAVMDALFSPFAVVKVGMCSSGVTILGHETGEAFADLVEFDNYFCDMSAKNRKDMQFEGNDYWIALEDARAMYEGDIQPDKFTNVDDSGNENAKSISVDESIELYREKVWLRDVWIPHKNKLITYGVKSHKVFNIVDWDGPKCGPYHVLGFSDVPSNILPLPPVSLLQDLNDLANLLFRRLSKQAEAKKSVAAFSGGNDDDVARLRGARDGDGIVYNGTKPEKLEVGGIDSPTMALFLQTKDLFSYMAGNLDALGGLGPMSETVGQDTMIQQSASARLDYMKSRTLDFARSVFKSLAWYEWTDPVRERTIEKPVKGSDITVQTKWSYETRDGDWLDYNFDIDVHSMQYDSPAVKLQKLGAVIERYIMPAYQQMQQQGGEIDFKELKETVAKLSNLPELNDIIKFGAPAPEQPETGNSEPTTKMPTNTTRTYERVNRPGATRHGKDDAMSRLLMGSKVQGAEMAALTRQVG